MCQVNVPKEVEDVVKEFVDKGTVFTAFDVTAAARGRTKQNVRHNDVRQYVVHFMNFEPEALTYAVSSVNLDIPSKGNPVAIVYHPQGIDPYSHPMAVKPSVQPDPVQDDGATVPATTSDPDGATPSPFDDTVVRITAEGRLNIPQAALDKITPVGGAFDIVVNNSVVPKKPAKDGRIRLGDRVVNKTGFIHTAFKVSVDISRNCVVVEPK